MALTQDGFTFGQKHGTVVAQTPADLFLVVHQFAGVLGESHLVGYTFGRDLGCDLTLDGFATLDDLNDALNLIDRQAGVLTGDLALTVPAGPPVVYRGCTFLGFARFPPGPFYDGSGRWGWVCFGRLLWRQRSIDVT